MSRPHYFHASWVAAGGAGTDTLFVHQNGQALLIQDNSAQIIYQFGVGGTTITVVNIEHITVQDTNGNPIFTWP